MRIARIVTRTPEEVESLAGKLRGWGYTVEILAPGEPHASPADLELTVDFCAAEHLLSRVAELATSTDADVFVAPGVLEPVKVVAPAVVESVKVASASVSNLRELSERDEEPALERGNAIRDALIAVTGNLRRFAAFVRQSVSATVHELNVRIAERRAARRQAQVAARRQRLQKRERPAVEPVRQRPATPPIAQKTPPVFGRRKSDHAPRPLPQIANLRTSSREREWRLVAGLSMALAAGVMFAWALASHKPVSPLPAALVMHSNSIHQQVPFGPVTLPAPATPKAQSATARSPRLQKPSPVRTRATGDEQEVVVRHFASPKPAVRTVSRDGVRHYSDME